MERRFSKAVRMVTGAVALMAGLSVATEVAAQSTPQATARIDWGIWIDPDGCMHWWADGGAEGYMVDRVNPRTGMPVCL